MNLFRNLARGEVCFTPAKPIVSTGPINGDFFPAVDVIELLTRTSVVAYY